MEEYNIIGDIAGNYDALMRLLNKMPSSATPLSVGDMIDRGPKSKEVVQFFMDNGKAVLGNHEHMMLDFVLESGIYNDSIWLCNSGVKTLMSYGAEVLINDKPHPKKNIPYWGTTIEVVESAIFPKDHIDWLSSLPLYIEQENLIVTHAPINPSISFELSQQVSGHSSGQALNNSVLWNRGRPKRRSMPNKFQVHGHNAYHGFVWHKDVEGEPFGINLDSSTGRVLTGMHWPSKEIFEEKL